ncbi:alpha/beta fold hydrolase [Methanobacterium sp.]|uniref:alpha/beta fold hydrolase n=1 Tax=Methanobacterium sp. TaxID=2164 RepID=UPI003C796429
MDLFVKETGRENEESIVFIHGGGLSGWMWDKQLEGFTDYHCLVPDLPEHGKSRDIVPFTMKTAAEQIIELINERAHNKKAHIVGISLGGQLVMQILGIAPEVVDHAIASGTVVRPYYGKVTLTMMPIMGAISKPLISNDFFIKKIMENGKIPLEYFENYKKDTKSLTYSLNKHILNENAAFRIPKGLCKVENPVLITMGETEMELVHESAEDMNRCIPNSKIFKAPGLCHVWNLQSPELFNKTLRACINDEELI